MSISNLLLHPALFLFVAILLFAGCSFSIEVFPWAMFPFCAFNDRICAFLYLFLCDQSFIFPVEVINFGYLGMDKFGKLCD